MRFMNEYDIDQALREYGTNGFVEPGRTVTPNRYFGAIVVANLAEWANEHSDGWCYWPKPVRAAARLIEHLSGGTYTERQERLQHDISDAELTASLRPIKAFLTRQGADHDSVIPRGH